MITCTGEAIPEDSCKVNINKEEKQEEPVWRMQLQSRHHGRSGDFSGVCIR